MAASPTDNNHTEESANMNRKLPLPALIAASALALSTINAHADNSQQNKMTTCNADATTKNLTGDDRKAFMKTCLSATTPAAAAPAAAAPAAAAPAAAASGNSQQQKMKTCNADATAKGLKGDDRKTFMSSCLKGST
jgi:hypothetical protein